MEKNDYGYVSTDIAIVMKDIEKYIIPENRRIIEYLWDNNILTTMTNNYENDFSWIQLGVLSEENERIFWERANAEYSKNEQNEPRFTMYKSLSVPVVPGTKDPYEEFMQLVDVFVPQDVQKDGYMTPEEFFLQYTDCYTYVDNPNKDKETIPEPQREDYPDTKAFLKAVKKYAEITTNPQNYLSRIKIVDQTKIKKPLMAYLEEYGFADCYDEEEQKIFYNKRLYDGHMRYKEMLKKHKK